MPRHACRDFVLPPPPPNFGVGWGSTLDILLFDMGPINLLPKVKTQPSFFITWKQYFFSVFIPQSGIGYPIISKVGLNWEEITTKNTSQ